MIGVVDIRRFPVKGLGGQPLDRIELAAGTPIRGDRRFAFAHDESAFDCAAPAWQPKREFLQLARDPGVAPVHAALDDAAELLTLTGGFGTGRSITIAPGSPAGRAEAAAFLAAETGGIRRPGQRLVELDEGGTLSDTGAPFVSIISLATVGAIAALARQPLDPRRFRGNILIDGAEPWAEFEWIGRQVQLGGATLRVLKRIPRCPATEVNPITAERDARPVTELRALYGHADLGIYAEVVEGGRFAIGDAIELLPE